MTIDQIKTANKARGFHWFDPDTLRFFKSRIGGAVYQGPGGVYFVTSECGPSGVRRYTVRQFTPSTGACETAPACPFNVWGREKAHKTARAMAATPPVPAWIKRLAQDVTERTAL